MNQTCDLPTGTAGHLQQGTCVLFTKFPHDFWNLCRSQSELIVLLRILKNIGFSGNGVSFESRDSMCRACFMTKNTLKKVIDELERRNIIVVDEGANRPHRITLHENIAGVKIETRYRNNTLYRGAELTPAKNNSTSEYQPEIERIHTKWIKGRYKVKWKEKKEDST